MRLEKKQNPSSDGMTQEFFISSEVQTLKFQENINFHELLEKDQERMPSFYESKLCTSRKSANESYSQTRGYIIGAIKILSKRNNFFRVKFNADQKKLWKFKEIFLKRVLVT